MNPARFTVRDRPHLDVEPCGLAREMRGDRLFPFCRAPFRAILGMKREPSEEIGPALECSFRREPVQFEHPRRRVILIGGDVPVPVTLARSLHGERVALFRELQCRLGALLRIDIAYRAGHSSRPSGFIAHTQPANPYPPIAAVGVPHTPLSVISGRPARQIILDRGQLAFRVVRVERDHPVPFGTVSYGHTRLESVEGLRAFGEEHLVGQHVPIPDAIGRSGHGEREALLRDPERLLGALAIRHVSAGPRPADRLSRSIAHAHAAELDPARLANDVRAQFHAEAGAGAGKKICHRTHPRVPVLRHER